MRETPDNTRSATPRSFQQKSFSRRAKPTFDANILEQRMTFALEVARVGVFRAGGAAEGSQGVIWNFTDTLTRVVTS